MAKTTEDIIGLIKENDIKETLTKKESYTDKIEELKNKVKDLDEKLGVKVE